MNDQIALLFVVPLLIGLLCWWVYAASRIKSAHEERRRTHPRWVEGPAPNTSTSTRRKHPMNHEHQHLVGAKARDLVTGIEGIITAVSYYLNGCVRVCIQPEAKDHKPADEVEWCDVQQVRRIGVGVRQQMGLAGTEAEPPVDYPRTAAVGGPQKDAPKA